jgi:hypothetical protein
MELKMKAFFITFLQAGIPFGITMGLFFGIFGGARRGMIAGIFCGLLFGLVLSIFVNVQKRKFQKIGMEITKGKNIIKEGAANHFKGAESVGGWLLLTSDEVVFKSHAFNIQKHQIHIPLNDMVEVKAVNTAGIIPNGLLIKNSDGIIERFVVNSRNKWVEKINDTRIMLNDKHFV